MEPDEVLLATPVLLLALDGFDFESSWKPVDLSPAFRVGFLAFVKRIPGGRAQSTLRNWMPPR